MKLVSNTKFMLEYDSSLEDESMRYRVYFIAGNSFFARIVWHNRTFQTKALRNFFSESEIRRAKAKRDAEKQVSKKFVS